MVQMASFVGPKTVVVNGVEYTADHINIAVGGRPIIPEVPGAEFCIDRYTRGVFWEGLRGSFCRDVYLHFHG